MGYIKVNEVCQLLNKNNYPATTTINGITFTNNGDGTITANGTATSPSSLHLGNISFDKTHKYLIKGCPSGGSVSTYFLYAQVSASNEYGEGTIWQPTSTEIMGVSFLVRTGTTISNLIIKPQLYDLTEIYGAGNEPTTVAEFRQKYPNDYYPYANKCWEKVNKHYIKTGENTYIPTYTRKIVYSWKLIQEIVRTGHASDFFKIGEILKVKRNNTYLDFQVLGVNQETPVDTTKQYSLTLGMKYTLEGVQFDSREAFFYNGTGSVMPAGTYNFKLGQHSWYSADVGKYIQFTLTQDLPIGGQLVWQQNYNATLIGASIKVFASNSILDNSPTETITMSEGQNGTYLGEIKNSFNTSGTYDIYLNHCQRALMGNNRWKDSAIRQWCNSSQASAYWTPQNGWDRQPGWYSNKAGFLNGLDSELLAVIGECQKDTEKANVDGGGHEITNDKVWLLSRYEIQSCTQAEAQSHTVYTWWHNLLGDTYGDWRTDTRFIKTNTGGSAQYWWLRSPSTGGGSSARTVHTSGRVSNGSAFDGYQTAVVFAII